MKELNGMRESTTGVTGRTKMLKVLNKGTSKIKRVVAATKEGPGWNQLEQFEVNHQNTAWIPADWDGPCGE